VANSNRFLFIDYLRGLVIAFMALDHASYYFNSIWPWFDPLDPLFDTIPQFLTRYSSYLCAPGFLMLAGAMVFLSFDRRIAKGVSPWKARWSTIQRGLFLILVQLTWVNSSWGGFTRIRLAHIGIIACIGISIALLALFVHWRWQLRLVFALVLFGIHPWLVTIPYDPHIGWQQFLMETFVTAGKFNKYPVIPWLALCTLGSVIAVGWFKAWTDRGKSIRYTFLLALVCFAGGALVRLGHGYGNLFAHSGFPSMSYFLFQKYPPSLVHQFWAAGAILFFGGVFQLIGDRWQRLLHPLRSWGSAALFFYLLHIPILALLVKRGPLAYRESGLGGTYLGWIALLIIMYPLSWWYGRVRARTKNPILKMI
jgi:uncharacterized membrane protein